MFDFRARQARLLEAMSRENVDALLAAGTENMRYIIGWAEPAGERFMGLWLGRGLEPTAVVPALYHEDIERGARSPVRVVAYADGTDWEPWLRSIRAALGASAVVAVDDELHAAHLLSLQRSLPDYTWTRGSRVLSRVRGVKDAGELELLRRSAAIADGVFEAVMSRVRPGVTEREVAAAIAQEFAARGAESSWALVAFGPNSSMPHHQTGGTVLEPGMVAVLDLGGSFRGYQSDITRTLAIGGVDAEVQRVYDIVYRAHMAAMEAARPGVRCREVDAAARGIIEDAGFGSYFIHRTGHGIGLSTHEPPNLSAGDDTLLEPGMCFSDEPGIYLRGRYGVRIENIMTITEAGASSLNAPPPPSIPVLEA